jgi:hypothetical protein
MDNNLYSSETLNKLDIRETGNATAPTTSTLHQVNIKLRA